ncbi:hypothetical protein N9W02_03515 [Flavobacteriaceae bacterium]|nr:hypothetical protein [Flavobacteriaceae bacterium]
MRRSLFMIALLLGFYQMVHGQSYGERFEELINEYVDRCENGPPTILSYPNRKGYLIEISDSTWVDYPQGRLFKMRRDDLGKEQAYKFNIGYHVNDSLYLVHSGGGVVYLHDGNTFKRVDESFYHHNQYGSASFSYDNDLFLFGGTGLFTRKNILTRYDRKAREWLLQKTDGQKPNFGASMAGMVIGDYFYLIGEPFIDSSQYDLQLIQELEKRFSIYRLNLKTWHWDLLGSVAPELSYDIYSIRNWVVDDENNLLYINCPRGLFAFDFVRNVVSKYRNPYPILGSRPLLGMESGDLVFIYCDSRQYLKTHTLTAENLAGGLEETNVLYQANLAVYYNTLLEVIAVLFLVSLILIVINELKFEKRIVIRLKGGSILFRSRNIRVFSPEEKELLMQLATSEALSFSDLEDIVSFPKDSQSVRVKKRDRVLRVLNEKIATIFNHDSAKRHDYFTVQNSSDDKRSRLLGLNGEYFKVM